MDNPEQYRSLITLLIRGAWVASVGMSQQTRAGVKKALISEMNSLQKGLPSAALKRSLVVLPRLLVEVIEEMMEDGL